MSPNIIWKTSRRTIDLTDRSIVMGILNVTPDSFSDGGRFVDVETAVRHAEKMIEDGADIIDIGGESTRPGSLRVDAEIESERTIPVIEALAKRFDVAVSIDTTKSEVARRAVDAGAEIINDISGLRFDSKIATVAADSNAGLVLMHSRGNFSEMHSHPRAEDVMLDVTAGLRRSLNEATDAGVEAEHIALDIGIGFGKSLEQNLELIDRLAEIAAEFHPQAILCGTSRKSFIGKLLGGAEPDQRLAGSLATAVIAMRNGAKVVRVHDVLETVQALRVADAVGRHGM